MMAEQLELKLVTTYGPTHQPFLVRNTYLNNQMLKQQIPI
jgi:hypothetical protein